MHFLEKYNISTRLVLASGAAALALLFLGIVSIFTVNRIMLEDRETKTRHLVEVAHTLVAHYQKAQAAGLMSEAEAKKAALDAIRNLRYEDSEYFWVQDSNLKMVMHPIKPKLDGQDLSGIKDPEGVPLFQRMDEVVRDKGAGFVEYMWSKAGSEEPVPKISYVKGFTPWGWIIGSGIYLDDVRAVFWQSVINFVFLLILGLGLLQGLFWLISRSILRQLGGEPRYAMEVAGRIAGGDLSQPISANQPGSVLQSIRDMQESLHNLFMKVHASAEQLTEGSRALSESAEQISAASSRQAESSSTVAAAVEEMAVSIGEVAEIAKQTEENSADTARHAKASEGLVSDTGVRIEAVADTVNQATEQIHTLRSRSDQIGGIATVIREIANQTNLLALNAAIEAARAGEMGRGFSVVADEVRVLAERTTQATSEIADMVAHVQSDTQTAVSSMENAVPQVQEGLDYARRVAEVLEQIRTQSDDSVGKAHDAAHATREQSTAMEDIARHVERIASMAEETHETVKINTEQSRLLEQLAEELRTSMARFKLA